MSYFKSKQLHLITYLRRCFEEACYMKITKSIYCFPLECFKNVLKPCSFQISSWMKVNVVLNNSFSNAVMSYFDVIYVNYTSKYWWKYSKIYWHLIQRMSWWLKRNFKSACYDCDFEKKKTFQKEYAQLQFCVRHNSSEKWIMLKYTLTYWNNWNSRQNKLTHGHTG